MLKKNWVKVSIGVILLIVIVISASLYYYNANAVSKPFSNIDGKTVIEIDDGDTLHSLMDRFEKEGYINNAGLAKLYFKLNDKNISLVPGEYELKSSMTMDQFLKVLEKAEKLSNTEEVVRVTIPEGYNIEKMGALLEKNGVTTKKEFIAAADSFIPPEYIVHTKNVRHVMEGYLFPDTYEFMKNQNAKDVVTTLSNRFTDILEMVEEETGKKYTAKEIEEIITVASIVEWEITDPSERGLAASVFYNRLQINQRLQSCATVLYALNEHKEYLTYDDLLFESDYNTYYADGLPPGPISNPGKESILATINHPETEYYYFVSKNDGTHQFSKTGEEHIKASETYQVGN